MAAVVAAAVTDYCAVNVENEHRKILERLQCRRCCCCTAARMSLMTRQVSARHCHSGGHWLTVCVCACARSKHTHTHTHISRQSNLPNCAATEAVLTEECQSVNVLELLLLL